MRCTLRALPAIAVVIAAVLTIGSVPAAGRQSRPAPQAISARRHGTHVKAHRHGKRHHKHRHNKVHRSSHPGAGSTASASRRSATRASFQCNGVDLVPTEENLAQIRSATICLVNRERVSHGERSLTVNGKLNRAAQGHSENMIAEDYFSHYGPAGDTPASRMRAAGYIYSSNIGYEVGENIAWGTLNLATPKAIVEAWMHSPGHRENILDSRYRETGMGVVAAVPHSDFSGQPGAIYTQDFGVLITG